MGRTVGFTFSIGARLQGSVASAFDTVAGRANRLRNDMKDLKRVSAAAGKVTSTRATVESLRAEAAAGKDVADKLSAAEKAYGSAQRSAAKYNVTVDNAASVHAKAVAQMQRTEASLKRQEAYQRNAAKRSELKGEIMGTFASVVAVAAPVKMAIEFESAMADAAKTIDGMRDDAGRLTPEYYKMEAAVKAMGRELPLTHAELASLFAAGGQMGMSSVDELREFTTLAAHMSVAFGMSTEEAADAIGGFQTKMGLSAAGTREMLDLMNQYANTSSATEKDIAGIVSRVGALGDIAGIANKPMTAMAATLASMKVPEQIAATGLKNFMLALTKGDAATKSQQAAMARLGIDNKKLAKQMQVDAEGAMISVLEKLKDLPAELQVSTLTELFGSESVGAIAPMLTQLDLLKKNFQLAGDSSVYAGAMQKEFENRSKTTANALIITKNKAAELGITIGAALLPAFNDTLTVIGNGAVALAAFAAEHPEAIRYVMLAASAMVGFKVATLAGRYSLTVMSDAWNMAKGVWAAGRVVCSASTWSMVAQRTAAYGLAVGTRAVAAAQWLLNAAMTNNPIGWVIKGVMFLGGALYTLYQTCEPVRKVLDTIWDGFLLALKPVTSKIEWVWGKIKRIIDWYNGGSNEAEAAADAKLAEQEKGKSSPVHTPDSATPVTAPSGPVSMPPPDFSGAGGGSADVDAFMAQAPSGTNMEAMLAQSGGMPAMPADLGMGAAASTTIAPVFNFQFSMDGIPDREFGKRVVDSVESESSAIMRILSGLLSDAQRVTYG